MLCRKCALLPLSLLVASASVRADGDGGLPSPINTDRPAVTASSVVVPQGSLQVENGFAFTVTQGQNLYDGPETLLRFGLASKTELRLYVPDYFAYTGMSSGFGDIAIGLKQQLGPTHGFDVSLILFLSMPSGAEAISSHGYDPAVQLPWSRSLSRGWTAAGMLSVYFPTQGARRNVTGETTFLLDRQLARHWDAFAEYAGDFPEQGGPRHLLHFGAAWKVTNQQQLDLHGAVGLSRATLDHFIGIGYSFRFNLARR